MGNPTRRWAELLPASLGGRILALQFAGAAAILGVGSLCAIEWAARERDAARADLAGWAVHDAMMQALDGRAPSGEFGSSSVVVRHGPGPLPADFTVQQRLPAPPSPPATLVPSDVTLWLKAGSLSDRSRATLDEAPTTRTYFTLLSRELVALNRESLLVVTLPQGPGVLRREVSTLRFESPSLWRDRLPPVSVLLSALAALGAVFVALGVASRALARPIHTLASSIDARGEEVQVPPLPETGPVEARAMARADNRLRTRLATVLADQTRMLAAVSHDLRTPSTRLRLRVELVAEAELREALLRDLDEMDEMLTEVLEFLSHEVREEAVKSVDLTALLQSVCDDYADLGRPVTFSEPPPLTFHGVPTLFASTQQTHVFQHARKVRQSCRPTALRRALCNLIDNALKYGHRADVQLDAGGDAVRIAVHDNGPGIPEDEMEKVFLPLYRLESSRQRSTGGIGLGLAIVKAVVAAHHGRIELRNRPEGGLVVSVELPRSLA
ncbi:ATP-binding protein [Piscinibacter gummiphilus]|uniref:histidine kinase n=1 Tax=Piscinibacter gummiphilus TaxID=946333 RepID=A0ABZ0CR82_9BURK|nr:ATP-binding protein [Piscinibacter gummiphilus]WOB07505.1 ATP-binding protein [Piscinibacter gummiphilus]